MLEKQNKFETYYIRGKHSNLDCFYLCQNYFILPRQTIRENANLIVLKKQDLKHIKHIHNDHDVTICQKMSSEISTKNCGINLTVLSL